MIFQNQAELHNVAELIPGEKGYTICRVPAAVQAAMKHPKAGNNWSGTELRFVIPFVSWQSSVFLEVDRTPVAGAGHE